MKLLNNEVRIETTNSCQAHCIICPRDKMTRPLAVMDNKHFKHLVDQAVTMGAETITLFGYGEPLLDLYIAEKIEYCTKHGLKTFITTNAGMLTEEKSYSLLDSGLRHIRFSCHGIGDNYEKVHRGLRWSKVINNIEDFVYFNETEFNHQCRVDVSIIPMNGENISEVIGFWESLADDIEVWSPHGWAGGKVYRTGERKLKTCGRPFNGPIQINADGTMMVCCFDFDGKLTVGNTYKDSIQAILKGKQFNEIRRKHTEGDLTGLICETCDQLFIEEDSPLLYSSIDPNCEINKTSSTKFKLQMEEIKENGFNAN